MKSETIAGRPSSSVTSWTITMPGCRNWAAARASRKNPLAVGPRQQQAGVQQLDRDRAYKPAVARLPHGAERPGHTLTPTALVHEAYLRLTDGEAVSWNSRGHFFSAAAEAMRRILVESARRRGALKRGGGLERIALETADVATKTRHDLVALDEALNQLERERPRLAQLVKLRYFAGLSMPQAAEVMGVSLRTTERDWTYAKAWLLEAMADEG